MIRNIIGLTIAFAILLAVFGSAALAGQTCYTTCNDMICTTYCY